MGKWNLDYHHLKFCKIQLWVKSEAPKVLLQNFNACRKFCYLRTPFPPPPKKNPSSTRSHFCCSVWDASQLVGYSSRYCTSGTTAPPPTSPFLFLTRSRGGGGGGGLTKPGGGREVSSNDGPGGRRRREKREGGGSRKKVCGKSTCVSST